MERWSMSHAMKQTGSTFRQLILLVAIAAAIGALAKSAAARADEPANDPALRDYYSANGLLQRGMYDMAAGEYRKFLASNGQSDKAPVARYGLGVCLFRMNRFDEAAQELAKIGRPQDFAFAAETALLLGQCHLAQQRFGQASESFRTVVSAHGESDVADDAGAMLVESLYRDGKLAEASEAASQFVSRHGQSPLRERAELFAGLSAFDRKEFPAAAEQFAGMLERFPQGQFADRASFLLAQSLQQSRQADAAIAQYRSVLRQESSPYRADAMLALAMMLHETGKLPESAALLDEFLQKSADHAGAAAAHFARGRIFFEQQQYDQAAASFSASAERDPETRGEVEYWLAKCELRQGKFAEAAVRLKTAIDQFPRSELLPQMYYDRAVALARAGDAAAAEVLADFRRRFSDHELAPDALELAAMLEHQARDYAASLAHCREFMARHAAHPHLAAVSYLAAENEFLAGNFEPAAAAYRQFLEKFPSDGQAASAGFRLGSALYRLDRLDDAEPLLAAAAKSGDAAFRPALLMLGEIHFKRERWQQAEQHLASYVAAGADPSAIAAADDALLKIGLAQQRQKHYSEALSSYDRLLSQFPKSPQRVQAMFERGQVLLELKQPEEATLAFTHVLDEDRRGRFAPYALNHLAWLAMNDRQYDKAADLFALASESGADTSIVADASFQHGQALLADGQYDPAERAFAKFIDDFANDPRAGEARARRAIALSRLGRRDEALAAIDQLETSKALDALESSLVSALAYEKAWSLREAGKSEEAAAAYKRLLEEDSLDAALRAHALLELADLESVAGRRESAAALLTQLRSTASADAIEPQVLQQGLYRLGVCQFELQKWSDAAATFEEFLAANPAAELAASAHLYAGESQLRQSRHRQAADHFAAVVEKYKTDPAYGPSLLRLGESAAALQQWDKSEEAYTAYLKDLPESELWFQAQVGIAWSKENRAQFDDAIESYQQVIARHQGPTAARAQFQIGECLYAQKKYEDAVRELLKVDILYAFPEWSAAAMYEAGRCFEAMSRPEEARAQFEQVRDKHPDTQWAPMASQRLKALGAANPAAPGNDRATPHSP
jgi:TolA-binding protein